MVYLGLTIVIGLIALALVYAALRMVLRRGWLLGFIRGCAGILVLTGALVVSLMAYDIYSYREIHKPQSIGVVSLRQLGNQRYIVMLLDENGRERQFELYGDQWQLDARIVRWPDLGWLHIKPGYRLDRISGRYYSLADERSRPSSVHPLNESLGIDMWQLLQDYSRQMSLLQTTYGSATFMPMVDNGLYEVSLSGTGLLAKPINDKAKAAVERWQ
ncbi:MAG: cation/multidrug efflux pump [Cellvibrionaceae bacterium]|nr:cation/multidrug efflux pump [Cellvibrionaceae bacterium]MCV6625048.1 cation/multidrug efflux pump [Cellvibrionaceae bacterium]